ncbi:MAG TPA: hypothetical protein VFD92_22630 [Candidatus Binatia bacterium]|nr:hypothetical protein [Candidatus Binatia bacterium]
MSGSAGHKEWTSRSARGDCCVESECLTGLRNNYFVGKRLTPDAFLVEQAYLNERRRLLNRAIHGYGVVYGFAVEPASGGIRIGSGLALDAVGREVYWGEQADVELGDVIALDDKRAVIPAGDTPPFARTGCWLLSVHYAEQRVGPVSVQDPCSCERTQWDRICETARFSLRYVDCAKCCQEPECELCCDCGAGPCSDERRNPDRRRREARDERSREVDADGCEEKSDNPVLRGGYQCLCDHLAHLAVGVECKDLTEIAEPCGRVLVDLHNGVPIACVRVTRDDCGPWRFDEWIEACGPRRLVKRNDVLFDLIRGCDLTRIVDTGWKGFHRRETPVAWHDFEQSWGTYSGAGNDQLTNYWLEFSRPVRKSTVRADCFAITVVEGEEEGGWGNVLRVPITGVQTEDSPNGPPDHVTRAAIVVDADWVKDAILSSKNRFNYQEALVEIEVRGDYIIDCNGQTVDADPVGLLPVPTGNGAPGGRYLSSFRVAPRIGRKS